ncbi:UNVERIFIED_CONTAM: hypothetical protein RMT77_010144 [Armadillidium vulgare]
MEKNIKREVEYNRTPTPELGEMNTQETEKRDSSIRTNISSKVESQIGRLIMRDLKQESRSEVEFSAFEGRSIIEVNQDEHEYDLTVTTSRDHSSLNEKRAIKKSYLECEKDSQSYSSQDKYNSEDLDKGSVVNQDDHEYDMHVVKRRDSPLYNEKKVVKKSRLNCEKVSQSSSSQNERNSKDLDKKRGKIQRSNFSNERRMWNEM